MSNINKDNNIFVITGEHPDKCVGGAELQAYLIAKYIRYFFNNVYFCTVFSDESFVKKENEKLIHISFKKEFLPKKIFHFLKYVKRYKPSILFVRCLYSFWWLKMISKIYRISIIFHISGDSQTEIKPLRLKYFYRILLKNFYVWATQYASLIIAQTNNQARLYENTFGINPVVIYNAQVPLKAECKKDFSIIKIIWIGKHYKNPEKFIELFEIMKKEQRFRFTIIGPLSEKQIQRFKLLEKEYSNIKYLGELNRKEVLNELEEVHVLINTSEQEGFPNTFIEAWHRGVIIISDKINPDDVLLQNKVGFVCESVSDIKNKLIELFDDNNSLAKQYSKNAFEYAKKYHNIEKTASDIYQIIKNVHY